MGKCGRTELEAAKTTFAEFRALIEAYDERERNEWERARWQVWHQYRLSPFIKAGNKPRKPQDIARFEWEKDALDAIPQGAIPTGEVTEEERQELDKIFELLNKDNNG